MTSDIDDLRKYLKEYFLKNIPGLLNLLNILCYMNFEEDCICLLFKSPSKLYYLILIKHRGDIFSADNMFLTAFLRPIITYFNKPDLAGKLMELVKIHKDYEFLDLIKRELSKGVSS